MTGTLRDQLQGIYDKNGRLDPPLVVKVARSPKHPLHHRFEWDDTIAGEAYRRVQAHELIQSAKVTIRRAEGEEVTVRAFHAVKRADSVLPSYEPAEVVLADPFLTKLVLADMERDILALKSRYDRFEEFRGLVARHLVA